MGTSTMKPFDSGERFDAKSVMFSTQNSISNLMPYGGLILTITTTVVALARFYLLQNIVLPRAYSSTSLAKMSSMQRRSFTNHHMAAALKIVLLSTAVYPLFAILSGKAMPSSPLSPGSKVTAGDLLVISTQIFTAMYLFELLFRDHVSPISCAHHVGAIVIAQSALAMSFDPKHKRDGLWEILLCFLWGKSAEFGSSLKIGSDVIILGAFDVVAELWPHIAMIYYRTHHDKHKFLAKLFYATMWLELLGTLVETIVMIVLFGLLWQEWSLSLKIATPILHVLFSSAQLWGAWIFFGLAKQQLRLSMRKATEDGS